MKFCTFAVTAALAAALNIASPGIAQPDQDASTSSARPTKAVTPTTAAKPSARAKPPTESSAANSHAFPKMKTFTVNVASWVSESSGAANLQSALNTCRGPVAIQFSGLPLLLAEHDYCGGITHVQARRVGDQVNINGAGSASGTYKVASVQYVPRDSPVTVLDGRGSVVLQTCVGSNLILVGLAHR